MFLFTQKTLIFTVTLVPADLMEGSDFAAVVGNIPELGSWDPAKGVKSAGPSDGQYTATVLVSDDTLEIEFKWVFYSGGIRNNLLFQKIYKMV